MGFANAEEVYKIFGMTLEVRADMETPRFISTTATSEKKCLETFF